MQIGEQWFYDEQEKKWVQKKIHDWSFGIEHAKNLSETHGGVVGESRLVGTIPMALINEWCKEAGVKWDDTKAREQVVKRKILSGDFDKFRVWKGKY
jgi:hypothetical protein